MMQVSKLCPVIKKYCSDQVAVTPTLDKMRKRNEEERKINPNAQPKEAKVESDEDDS
jgi:hypothetical protein